MVAQRASTEQIRIPSRLLLQFLYEVLLTEPICISRKVFLTSKWFLCTRRISGKGLIPFPRTHAVHLRSFLPRSLRLSLMNYVGSSLLLGWGQRPLMVCNKIASTASQHNGSPRPSTLLGWKALTGNGPSQLCSHKTKLMICLGRVTRVGITRLARRVHSSMRRDHPPLD